MTAFNNRSTALLVCFIALIAYAKAQPDAPEGFDDMNWTTWSNMGMQFGDMIANQQFAHMVCLDSKATSCHFGTDDALKTASPMSTNGHASPSYRPYPRRPRSPQTARPSNANDMDLLSTWDTSFNEQLEMRFEAPDVQVRESSLPTVQASEINQEQHITTHNFDSSLPDTQQQWIRAQDWNIDPLLTGEGDLLQGMPSTATPSIAQIPSFTNDSTQAMQHLSHSWSFNSQANDVAPLDHPDWTMHSSDTQEQFQASQIPQSHPETFELGEETSTPEILSSDITNNYNYQEGLAQGTVGNMRGWIGRAPMTGERAVPRLDTNHLAPPDSSSANRSPTSASTTGSSFRSGSRRRPWEMTTGDFICGHCNAGFPTQGDLTHHLRSHASYMSRQHVCHNCEKRFQYRKDLLRHLPRHDPNRKKFYCSIRTCKYHSKGFGREDHLQRHLLSQHRVDTPQRMDSRSPSNRERATMNVTN